jgi:hypothetical protein
MKLEPMETELGTRVLFLTHGGSVKVTHTDSGLVRISVASTDQAPLARVELFLDVREALTLVEFLAIALKPGSSNEIIEALPSGDRL